MQCKYIQLPVFKSYWLAFPSLKHDEKANQRQGEDIGNVKATNAQNITPKLQIQKIQIRSRSRQPRRKTGSQEASQRWTIPKEFINTHEKILDPTSNSANWSNVKRLYTPCVGNNFLKNLATLGASKGVGNGACRPAQMESNLARMRWVGDAPTLGCTSSISLHMLKGSFHRYRKRGAEMFKDDYLGRVCDERKSQMMHVTSIGEWESWCTESFNGISAGVRSYPEQPPSRWVNSKCNFEWKRQVTEDCVECGTFYLNKSKLIMNRYDHTKKYYIYKNRREKEHTPTSGQSMVRTFSWGWEGGKTV